jgi:hypothetical protein
MAEEGQEEEGGEGREPGQGAGARVFGGGEASGMTHVCPPSNRIGSFAVHRPVLAS